MQNEKLDQVDQANAIAEKWIGANEQAIRELVPEERDAPEEVPECVECGRTYPVKRYELGYDTCVDCSSYAEKMQKIHSKTYRRGGYDD